MQIVTGSLISLTEEDRTKLVVTFHLLEGKDTINEEQYGAILFTKQLLSALISGETNI